MIAAMQKTLLVAQNNGIIPFRERPLEMFLPLATLRQAIEEVS